MKRTIILMTADVILLLLPLMAFIGYTVGFVLTQNNLWAAPFAVAGLLFGAVALAVFEKAVK